MNNECSSTIPRQGGKLKNGTWKILLGWRKHTWAEQEWKQYYHYFNSYGIVHKEFALLGWTVNHLLQRCLGTTSKMHWVSPTEHCCRQLGWLCDNAFAHTALFQFENFLQRKTCFRSLPAPRPMLCHFYLFPKLNLKLKGHHFRPVENKQQILTNELNKLMDNDFQYYYNQWNNAGTTVTCQWLYFEGDNL